MKLYGLAGVAALAAVGGTFAYYSATTDFNNQFDTVNYSTSTTEQFNPNGDNKKWEPGVTVAKKVYATNTGDGDVWVRIKFDEAWFKQEENKGFAEGAPLVFAGDKKGFSTTDGLEKFGVETDTDITKVSSAAHQGIGDNYSKDGDVSKDSGSVVLKHFDKDWETNWYFADGYFYYKTALKKGQTTPTLLEGVTLCDDTDMGYFDEPVYYTSVKKGSEVPVFPDAEWKKNKEATEVTKDGITWTKGVPSMTEDEIKKLDIDVYTYKGNILDEDKPGYAKADYKLDIKVEFVQTNKEGQAAFDSTWDAGIVEQLIANTAADNAQDGE